MQVLNKVKVYYTQILPDGSIKNFTKESNVVNTNLISKHKYIEIPIKTEPISNRKNNYFYYFVLPIILKRFILFK